MRLRKRPRPDPERYRACSRDSGIPSPDDIEAAKGCAVVLCAVALISVAVIGALAAWWFFR